jgi:ribosomal-protein-alanine N-acetyltransferase
VIGPAITLSEGNVADLDAVMTVMDESFEQRFGEAWTASQCAGLLPLPGVWLTLAKEGPAVVGFALARAVAGEAELLLLAVRGAWRRSGIGKTLLESFIRSAEARGVTSFHLEVRDGNEAISLYTDAGFQLVGRRRNYYSGWQGKTFDALTLAKSNTAKFS